MAKQYRIGIGGIAIESSTFSPLPSVTDNFVIHRGDEIVANYPYFENGTFDGREECLVPAAEEFIAAIDFDKRKIKLVLPEGLLEL